MTKAEDKSVRISRLLFIICLGVLALILTFNCLMHSTFESDTEKLIRGVPVIEKCLLSKSFTNCNGASYFALLQQIPIWIEMHLDFSVAAAAKSLSIFSLLSLFLMCGLGVRAIYSRKVGGCYYWLVGMLSGPFLVYSSKSFSEPMAAFFIFLFMYSLLVSESVWLIACSALGAGVSKETAPLFLLAFVPLAFRGQNIRDPKVQKRLLFAFSALALSVFVNFGFNIIRFGTWKNTFYSQPILHVHNLATYLSFFAGAFLSPSGGLIFFFPAVSFFLLIGLFKGEPRQRTNYFGVLLALIGYVAVLSYWHSPFGWNCWGDRLLLPWIPALLFYFLFSAPLPKQTLTTKQAIGVGIILGVLSLPQLLVVFDNVWVWDTFRPIPGCKDLPDFWSDIPQYYQCINLYLWPLEPTIARIFRVLWADASFPWIAASYVSFFVSAFYLENKKERSS